MTEKHLKKCSSFLAIRELNASKSFDISSYTTQNDYYHDYQPTHAGVDVQQGQHSSVAAGSAHSFSYQGNQCYGSSGRWKLYSSPSYFEVYFGVKPSKLLRVVKDSLYIADENWLIGSEGKLNKFTHINLFIMVHLFFLCSLQGPCCPLCSCHACCPINPPSDSKSL